MAPRRDIYVAEDDVALWDEAENLAGDVFLEVWAHRTELS